MWGYVCLRGFTCVCMGLRVSVWLYVCLRGFTCVCVGLHVSVFFTCFCVGLRVFCCLSYSTRLRTLIAQIRPEEVVFPRDKLSKKTRTIFSNELKGNVIRNPVKVSKNNVKSSVCVCVVCVCACTFVCACVCVCFVQKIFPPFFCLNGVSNK